MQCWRLNLVSTPPQSGPTFLDGLIVFEDGVAIGDHSLNDRSKQVFVPINVDDRPAMSGSRILRASIADGKFVSPKANDSSGAIIVLVSSRNVGEPGKPAIPFTSDGTIRTHHPLRIAENGGVFCVARGQSTDHIRNGDHQVTIVSETKLLKIHRGGTFSFTPAGTSIRFHITNTNGYPSVHTGGEEASLKVRRPRVILPDTEEPLGVGGAVTMMVM